MTPVFTVFKENVEDALRARNIVAPLHILKAELISADSSDEDDNAKQAQDFLKSRYPDYTIELTKTVDADLLGGYVIRAHHKEYDRSFEGRFCQLERKLTGR